MGEGRDMSVHQKIMYGKKVNGEKSQEICRLIYTGYLELHVAILTDCTCFHCSLADGLLVSLLYFVRKSIFHFSCQ